jgi:hypothetical protein
MDFGYQYARLAASVDFFFAMCYSNDGPHGSMFTEHARSDNPAQYFAAGIDRFPAAPDKLVIGLWVHPPSPSSCPLSLAARTDIVGVVCRPLYFLDYTCDPGTAPGAAAVASFLAAALTEIYLGDVCSCPEILRYNGRPSPAAVLGRAVPQDAQPALHLGARPDLVRRGASAEIGQTRPRPAAGTWMTMAFSGACARALSRSRSRPPPPSLSPPLCRHLSAAVPLCIERPAACSLVSGHRPWLLHAASEAPRSCRSLLTRQRSRGTVARAWCWCKQGAEVTLDAWNQTEGAVFLNWKRPHNHTIHTIVYNTPESLAGKYRLMAAKHVRGTGFWVASGRWPEHTPLSTAAARAIWQSVQTNFVDA